MKMFKSWIGPIKIMMLVGGLAGGEGVNAQGISSDHGWGKHSSISKTSLSLDGVKPMASWIWDSGAENPKNYYLLVRKTFNLEALPGEADAFISAYASADVYINGRLLERCPMNCDPEYQCYDHFSISSYLKKGENCISAIVQNFGVGLHSQINARGGFFFQAKLSYPGSGSIDLLSDTSWRVTHASAWNTETRFRDSNAHLIGFIEEFDARLWPGGWQNVEFKDAAWEHATMIGVPPVAPWNGLTVIERPELVRKVVKPVRKWRAGNLMVYDFGVEIAGYPQFTVDAAKEGVQFEIGTGERVDSNRAPLLRVSSDHSEKYTTRAGLQSWRPYTWTGFRYFSIEMRPDIEIRDVSAEFACYDYEMQSSFECSDSLLNEYWNIGRYTMRLNSIDTYQDPWREHTQYIAGDSRYMLIYGNYAFGKSSRLLSAYNLLCGAQSQRWRKDGAVRSRYPTDYFTQPGSSTYLTDYQLEWVLMMHEYFLYYGKDDLIGRLYPNLKKAMEYYRPFIDEKTGLLANLPGWIVLDWPDTYGMERKKIITGLNCLYYGALNAAAAIASDIGHDPQQAQQWKEQASQLKENINKGLWSAGARAYLDSYDGMKIGQQSQVYVLKYGLAEAGQKNDMMKLIMQRGKASEQSFAYWMLNVMFSEGHEQWALDYMRKNWGEQTHLSSFNGAWHEGWNLPWGSTSHAWSSGPTALLPQKVLGLEPTEYGWKSFMVKPAMGDLKWAKGTVATVAGDISAAWQRSAGNQFTLKLNVPKGTTATVYLPTSDQRSILINGEAMAKMAGVKFQMEDSKWGVLTVGAGDYQFECEIVNRSGPVDRGRSPIAEPYPYVSGGGYKDVKVPLSPDPLVAYRWSNPKADDGLQIYLQKPEIISTDAPASFDNLGSLKGNSPNVKVKGVGSIRVDFGRENAAWLEFDSPDLSDSIEMSISEYNQPASASVVPNRQTKTLSPKKYGNTYRLELNKELYEGVRFGWIHVRSFSKIWHITGIRLVCQIKPANYNGSFSCSDTMLTRIWYTGAYTVKLNLLKDYFGAILMYRGDRFSWTGDAHPAQAASMVAFGNYDFVKRNIEFTAGESNGIRSYSLYWVLSLIDYYNYTGDTATLQTYAANAMEKLEDAYKVYGTNPNLEYFGWDERLGAGFEHPNMPEPQKAYKMLSIRAWKMFGDAMAKCGRADLQSKYNGYANEKMKEWRENGLWYLDLGLHSGADAINTGLLNKVEAGAIYGNSFSDRVNRVSYSPFNQYFVIQALAEMNKYDDALSSIRDLWGGQIKYGGTTFFEDYRASWNRVMGKNDPVPNNQCGFTSLCHPWGAGVTKWLSEEVLGIKPGSPGFGSYEILPHLGRTLTYVSGDVSTPKGKIYASFNVATGEGLVTSPAGTVGRIGVPKVYRNILSIAINGSVVWDGTFHSVAGIGGASEDSSFVYFTGVEPGSYTFVTKYGGTTPRYKEQPEQYRARYVGMDAATGGNWGGVYGRDGYTLCNYKGNGVDKQSLPSYVSSLNYYKVKGNGKPLDLVWESNTHERRALASDATNSGSRTAACLYAVDPDQIGYTFTVGVDVKDTHKYKISLYFLDWDKRGREVAVEMFDGKTLNLIAPVKIVRGFVGGAYLIYAYDGSAKFRINMVRGSDAILSGIFFDRDE